jgi:hypothetical protein
MTIAGTSVAPATGVIVIVTVTGITLETTTPPLRGLGGNLY